MRPMNQIDRRLFMRSGAMALGNGMAMAALAPRTLGAAAFPTSQIKQVFSLRIEPCNLEIAPGVVVKTTAYNGQVPGPARTSSIGMASPSIR